LGGHGDRHALDQGGEMLMRQFRWRIRTLMAVVAIAASSLGVYDLWRRGQSYRLQAWYHLAATRQLANDSRSFLCSYGLTERQIEANRARRAAERSVLLKASEYHLRLHAKYQRASERPWLPVGPDPPPPPGSHPSLVTADDY
jgi:hypothetical protein